MSSQALEPKATGKQNPNQVAVQRHQAIAAISPHASGTSCLDLTKEEVLEGIAEGFLNVMAGEYRPIEELFDELG